MTSADRIKRKLGRIYGRRSSASLDSMLLAIGQQFDVLGIDVSNAISQLNVTTSSEDWADFWGTVFGIPRKASAEPDGTYTDRIIEETIRQRPQPQALTSIVKKSLGVTMLVRDLWPMVLKTNQFVVPAGRPPQVLNGHLAPGWTPGAVDDQAVRLAFGAPYLEGAFGVWLDVQPGEPFQYTIENIIALLPDKLLTNQFAPGSLHTLNGHLTTPDLGGPSDTARYLFGVSPQALPATVDQVMTLIERHRAAGTQAVFMGFIVSE